MAIKRLQFALFGLTLTGAGLVTADDGVSDTRALRQEAAKFERGSGGKPDYAEAYRLYCKASLLGDREAASSLGWMYMNRRGVPLDMERAMGWFRKAADQGDGFAARMISRHANVSPANDPDCRPERHRAPAMKHDFGPPPVRFAGPGRELIEGWVKRIAPKYAIDPELVMAVIQAESAFNPAALSGKNAQGLMQLIPETAERFGIRDVWNPIENIKGGTAYLHWLLRHFSGNVEWALAAYNAGENNVEKYQGVPPFAETQHYVHNILAGYQKTEHPVPPELVKQKEIDREILRLASVLQPL